MKRHDTFLKKYIYVSLYFSKGSKLLSVWERDRERDKERQRDEIRGHKPVKDCYIDVFLTHVVIPYSEPYVLASLTRGSQLEATNPPRAPVSPSLAFLWTPWLPDRLTDFCDWLSDVGIRTYTVTMKYNTLIHSLWVWGRCMETVVGKAGKI